MVNICKYPQSLSSGIVCKSIARMQPPRSTIMRSVKALEADLVTLEKRYNLCSEHLAMGETEDFNQAWFGMQPWTNNPWWHNMRHLKSRLNDLRFLTALHHEIIFTSRWLQSLETPSAFCKGGRCALKRWWRRARLSAFVCSIYFDQYLLGWGKSTFSHWFCMTFTQRVKFKVFDRTYLPHGWFRKTINQIGLHAFLCCIQVHEGRAERVQDSAPSSISLAWLHSELCWLKIGTIGWHLQPVERVMLL